MRAKWIHDPVGPIARLRIKIGARQLGQDLRAGIHQADGAALIAALLNGDAADLVEQLRAILQPQNGRTGAAQHAVGACQAAQPFFLFSADVLRVAPVGLELGLAQCAFNGRGEPRQIALQHIVSRAASQCIDSPLFTDGPRHIDKGRIGGVDHREVEGPQAAEVGQGEIGKNQVRFVLVQCRDEFRFSLDPVDGAMQARFSQMPGQQLGIRYAVFHDNQLQLGPHRE